MNEFLAFPFGGAEYHGCNITKKSEGTRGEDASLNSQEDPLPHHPRPPWKRDGKPTQKRKLNASRGNATAKSDGQDRRLRKTTTKGEETF